MNYNVIDITGKDIGTIILEENVFNSKVNKNLLLQYIRVFLSNRRQGTSSTKTRGEVSGGGKKPWRQKGTGRARHGSIRSPIWVGGGISHGPKPVSWALSLPKKMRKLSMISALSSKTQSKDLKVIEDFNFDSPKTKQMEDFINKLSLSNRTLIILASNNLHTRKSTQNIKSISTSLVENVNPYEIINAKNLLIEKSAVEILNNKYKTL